MDRKTINNKQVRAVVKYESFLFAPNFNCGQRAGVFYLNAYLIEEKKHITTSDIIDIHEIDGVVYMETQNSIYELDGSEEIMRLENVKRYLYDEKYTSDEIFDKCVANTMPTTRGWKIF